MPENSPYFGLFSVRIGRKSTGIDGIWAKKQAICLKNARNVVKKDKS